MENPEATFTLKAFQPKGIMGYYPHFHEAIPLLGVGYLRVTHPFAAIPEKLVNLPRRVGFLIFLGSLDLHA